MHVDVYVCQLLLWQHANSRSQQFITQTSLSYSWLWELSIVLLGPTGRGVTWLHVTVWVQVHSTYWSFFWEPGSRGSHRLGCAVLWQREETHKDEQNHGITLKSFTWNRHTVTAAHISLFHASQITQPKVMEPGEYAHICICGPCVLVPGTQLLKLLDFIGVFSFRVLMKWIIGKEVLGSFRRRMGHQKNQPYECSVRTFGPPCPQGGRRKGGQLSSFKDVRRFTLL